MLQYLFLHLPVGRGTARGGPENRPGAGTNVATEALVRAPADGYTLGLIGLPNAINASLYDKLSFNFIRDVTPVAGILRTPEIMVVNLSVPAKTLPEFIAHAKANPGKINMGSAGNGSVSHVAGELFKMMAGVDLVHVPYRGAQPALTDVISGQVQVMFAASTVEYIKTGKVRALAVTTPTRSAGRAGRSPLLRLPSSAACKRWSARAHPQASAAAVVRSIGGCITNCI
jgi:tripartite-type tricarboxylate transporter receptor subunit TctC